jgi:hypothetical protein
LQENLVDCLTAKCVSSIKELVPVDEWTMCQLFWPSTGSGKLSVLELSAK